MKRFVTPALVAGICSLAIALPQPQQGQRMIGGGLQGPGSRVHVPAPQLTAPIVHQGIPGERIEGGIYVERSVLGEDRLHDLSLGTNPILPVQPGSSTGSDDTYLDGCPCPTGSRFEGEPDCGVGSPCDFADTFNGGCNSAPPVFSPIKLGDVVCGETTYDTGLSCRDTDWYETVLTQTTTVTWTVSGPFDKVVAIIDGSGCPPSVVTILTVPGGCGADATVSATLPAGTWWFFIAPDFTSDVTCGTNYTARLTGGCQIYTSAAAFDGANPGLTLEDFEDFAVAPGSFCGSEPTPWDSTTSNSCVSPGDITPGLEFDSISSGSAFVIAVGYAGTGNTMDSNSVMPFAGGPVSELRFDPPVRSVGVELEFIFTGAGDVGVEIFDAGGGSILATTLSIADSAETFWGVSCGTPIATLRVTDTPGLFPCYGSIRYGGTGDCEFITNETQFNARFPGLALENFEDLMAPIGFCLDAPPWDATTANACVSPGEIEEGLILDSLPNSVGLGDFALLAIGYAGTVESQSVVGNAVPDLGTELRFDPPVTRVGFDIEGVFGGTGPVQIVVVDPGGAPISSTHIAVGASQTFVGIACDALIGGVRIDEATSLFVAVDNIRFGTGCQLIADGDDFDSLYPDLAFEDFEDTSVSPGTGCPDLPPWNSTTSNSCILPGQIEPGLEVDNLGAPGLPLVLLGIGYVGSDSKSIVGAAAPNDTELVFAPAVRHVGFTLETAFGEPAAATITLVGAGGEILSSTEVEIEFANRFFGFACDQPIASVRIQGADAELVDNIRFGTSKLPFTRYCVEDSVASVNTGLKTKMLLETQDGAGNLLPFDKSIAGNGSPNRLMMIAKDAPGTGNGGVTNIGYFIMGTGSNTFVPPGSIGPICVAPGIKRYLPPTSMTSETIVFHDAGGTPTTLVAQGFSRVALGAGAHPIGSNIGGVLGFHWSFQAWHRDTPGDSNLSDAIAVDFVP